MASTKEAATACGALKIKKERISPTKTTTTTTTNNNQGFRICHSAAPLGDWEQHTRGIASRVMRKMGYVAGAGQGRDPRSSRVFPVTATMYPRGKSLDWCMELREREGGGDIFSVEKTSDIFSVAEMVRRQQARDREGEKSMARTVREGGERRIERSGRAEQIKVNCKSVFSNHFLYTRNMTNKGCGILATSLIP